MIRRSECWTRSVLDPRPLQKAGIDAPYSRVCRCGGSLAGVFVIDGVTGQRLFTHEFDISCATLSIQTSSVDVNVRARVAQTCLRLSEYCVESRGESIWEFSRVVLVSPAPAARRSLLRHLTMALYSHQFSVAPFSPFSPAPAHSRGQRWCS